MWPGERKRNVLRIGRVAAEVWVWSPLGLNFSGSRPLTDHSAAGLLATLSDLMAQTENDPGASRPFDVVVESAWLPVMLFHVGPTLWSQRKLEALLRHRFEQTYSDRDDPVSTWLLQFDHRPGDLHAFGYGLVPSVRQSVLDAARKTGLRIASLQPAFAWSWKRLRGDRACARGGWWLWLEQDRTMLAWVQDGDVVALNPAAEPSVSEARLLHLATVEGNRLGVSDASALVVGGWVQPHLEGHLTWLSVTAGNVAVLESTQPSVQDAAP